MRLGTSAVITLMTSRSYALQVSLMDVCGLFFYALVGGRGVLLSGIGVGSGGGGGGGGGGLSPLTMSTLLKSTTASRK